MIAARRSSAESFIVIPKPLVDEVSVCLLTTQSQGMLVEVVEEENRRKKPKGHPSCEPVASSQPLSQQQSLRRLTSPIVSSKAWSHQRRHDARYSVCSGDPRISR